MGLSRLLVLAALLASATSSPIVPSISEDDVLPSRTAHATDAGEDAGAAESPVLPTVSESRIRRMGRGPPTWRQSAMDSPTGSDFDGSQGGEPGSHSIPPARDGATPQRPQDIPASHWTLLSLQRLHVAPSSCTRTIFQPEPSPCAWNGVLTMYPSTTTAFKEVNCHGCSNVLVNKQYYHCPIQRIDATEHATTASTSWRTVCAASASTTASLGAASAPVPAQATGAQPSTPKAPPQPAATQTRPLPAQMPVPTSIIHPPQSALSPVTTQAPPMTTGMPILELVRKRRGTEDAEDVEDAELQGRDADPGQKGAAVACPTTFVVSPPKTAGVIWTQFAQIRTTTVLLSCAGCPSMVTSTAVMGYGQPARFKSTTTVPFGYTTVYKCS